MTIKVLYLNKSEEDIFDEIKKNFSLHKISEIFFIKFHDYGFTFYKNNKSSKIKTSFFFRTDVNLCYRVVFEKCRNVDKSDILNIKEMEGAIIDFLVSCGGMTPFKNH